MLGHLVSNRDIEVDKSKIDIITSSKPHFSAGGFYRRFIKNFSKTALPLFKLLQKDVEFKFDQPYASNSALGAILGQRARVGKLVHVIAYASRTMDPTQLN
ncbi:hypothetical protein CR513_11147, partial [Mucuna pruriens]